MSETLENLLQETRRFEPPAELAAHANVTADAYDAGRRRPARLLGAAGPPAGPGRQEWDQVLDWSNPPFAKWFVGGAAQRRVQLPRPARRGRAAATRSRSTGRASRATPARSPTPTCTSSVCQAANTLTDLGVGAGDRVAIYLPMIPEAAVAMLACARIGATHSVVFGGFSVDALVRPHPGRRAPRS